MLVVEMERRLNFSETDDVINGLDFNTMLLVRLAKVDNGNIALLHTLFLYSFTRFEWDSRKQRRGILVELFVVVSCVFSVRMFFHLVYSFFLFFSSLCSHTLSLHAVLLCPVFCNATAYTECVKFFASQCVRFGVLCRAVNAVSHVCILTLSVYACV